MKRFFYVFLMVMFLYGCGAAARESGFYEHDTMYKNWDHLKFSIFGFKQVDQQNAKLSQEQDWWGIPINHQ